MPDTFKNALFGFNHLSATTPFGESGNDEQLEKYLRLSSKVFEHSLEGICITNKEGTILLVNPSFTRITGYDINDVIGKNPRILKSGLQEPSFYSKMWDTLISEGKWIGEFRNIRKNGEMYIQHTTICSLTDKNGEITHYASIITDVTKVKLAEEKLFEDLHLAKFVQKNMFSQPLKTSKIEINGINVASENLAGDMYVWYQISETQYGVILIDVMGHGVASALVCMSIRSLLYGLITRVKDPRSVIEELNKHMLSLFSKTKGKAPHYFTAIYLLINTQAKTIKYVNAGHPPGLIYTEDQNIQQLCSTCTPIGFLPKIDVENGCMFYNEPLTILLYTDGIFREQASLQTEIADLATTFSRCSSLDNELIPSTIINSYHCKNYLTDDVSIISIKIG